ncbi:MAG: PQQ-dependent sugar dehydrogenase [Actinomycetota bacterium]
MRRALLAIALALLLPLPTGVSAAPRVATAGAQAVASGLDFPAAMTFAPDGRLFYGERFTGEIRIRNLSTNADTSFFTIPTVATAGEQGLLGLAVHPNYPAKPLVYAYATRTVNGAPQNQLIRIQASNDVGAQMRVMLPIPAGTIHNGGVLLLVGNRLHVLVGDVGNPANSQNTAALPGKVLRVNLSGRSHPQNTLGNRTFSFGHRNMFGIASDPQSGRVWVSENGPGCNDEANPLVNGGNFAWGPSQQCGSMTAPLDTNRDGPQPRLLPPWFSVPTIAPTGMAFCQNCGLDAATEGTLLMGAWNDGGIRRLTLDGARTGVTGSSLIYDHDQGVLAMVRASGGTIYFSDPDQIYKLVP